MAFPDRLRTNFELVRELPSNKPFDVFLVKDKTKDFRSCVLRVLPASLSGKKTAVEAFMGYFSKFSEIINRAYIPSVYSVSGQVGGNVYVLEEHVSGIDLTTFIKSKRNTPEFNREIISIAGKVCEALHHAHQKDLFHLGITPEDILIDTSTGRVKLVGFGVQIFTQLNKMGILSAHACKTIAPEILTGDPLRPRTDVYSLAKVMNDVCPEVFFGSDVLSMALLENPEDRYQQARDFEGALNNVLEDINKAARSRNIDTVADSKGGLKPVLTEKPVTAERDVYQPPPRKPNTPQSPPQIKPDTAPPKSISVKLVGAIAVGSIVAIVVLILNVYQGKQRETNQIKEAARVAAIEKEQREKELELPAFAWNYPEDVKNLMKRAFKGDASAQFGMALKYSKGQGIPKDELEAVKWYRKSADQGYASAQYNLGLSYKKGEGVPKDFSEAVKWYRKAAIQENVWARNNLGSCYKKGEGVPKDFSEAVKWYRKAAIQGHAPAQYNLGLSYKKGEGVSKDEYKAVMWYRDAAWQGHAPAQYNLGLSYKKGEGVSKDEYKAVKWYRKAAEQGHAEAQSDLGLMYYRGWGVGKDYSAAAGWFRKAANQGFARAQYNLGVCYENGDEVSKDYSEAAKWYRKAADQGDADAQSDLGLMYYNGRGVSKNYSEAWTWFKKSADLGNASAQNSLGLMYAEGHGVTKDYSQAVIWYKLAADQGDASAQFNLGNMYFDEKGVAKNYSEALKWFRKAAAQDNQVAKDKLKELGLKP